MSIISRLQELDLDSGAMATLTYSEGTDVFVHNESEVETALSETDVVSQLCSLLAMPGVQVTTSYGDDILGELRESNLLDDYEHDFTFEEYLNDVVTESIYDFDFIDRSVEKYDYKRGYCTLTAEVQVPVAQILEKELYVDHWNVSVNFKGGTLTLSA